MNPAKLTWPAVDRLQGQLQAVARSEACGGPMHALQACPGSTCFALCLVRRAGFIQVLCSILILSHFAFLLACPITFLCSCIFPFFSVTCGGAVSLGHVRVGLFSLILHPHDDKLKVTWWAASANIMKSILRHNNVLLFHSL